ncbi:MAG: DUF3795 domain-containing protein [Thermodesulfobacteriota bacterium]
MREHIAYCGLPCHDCEAFLMKTHYDRPKAAEVAGRWSKVLKMDLKPEDIVCEGCRADSGVQFRHCASCKIRKCAQERSITVCAHCDEYVCDKLKKFYAQMTPEAKERLENIRGKSKA